MVTRLQQTDLKMFSSFILCKMTPDSVKKRSLETKPYPQRLSADSSIQFIKYKERERKEALVLASEWTLPSLSN